MGEFNPLEICKMDREILDIFIKYGLGRMKMYDSTYFICLNDETACLTLQEFSEKSVVVKDLIYDEVPTEYQKGVLDCLKMIQEIKDNYNNSKIKEEKVEINYGTICDLIINMESLIK